MMMKHINRGISWSSDDDDYNYIQKPNTRGQEKKRKLSINNEKSTKSKTKEGNELSEPTKKKQKVTEPKNPKQRKQNVDKDKLEQMVNNARKIDFNSIECKEWTDVEYVSEVNDVDKRIAENVIKLFNEENTIPFIARYRKNMTGSMEPDKLRALKESFEQAKAIKQRAATILKTIDKLGQWTPNLHSAIASAKCLDDLEHIYSLFKPASKRCLAERAREVGLGPVSDSLLKGDSLPPLSSLVDAKKKGLETKQQIKDGIIHIIADTIRKNKEVFDKIKTLQEESIIQIQTTECQTAKSTNNNQKDVDRKYEMYYNFSSSVKNIRPHQILAINRGEAQKILNVKVALPDSLGQELKKYCLEKYKQAITASDLHSMLLHASIDHAYTKFIKPFIVRRVRNELKQKAEVASIEVFVTNVKQLLLTPPVRGKVILGIDPGFHHGCKLAVISEQGNVLETGIIYPHGKGPNSYTTSIKTLVNLVRRHKCTLVALGNATACRETESFLTKLIESKEFGSMNVMYTIVDEAGASIYSCSSEAKAEFKDLDPNIISAISIARRLQDPLAELVKVEPKHLGVGMYQHDLPEKQLSQALNEVVSEAVSFVGVDVNTASQCLLKRVAGLNASKASSIIEWRTEFGPFKNRQQLLEVKGIGGKTFEQCAGFIRILPETSTTADTVVKSKRAQNSKHAVDLLDQTWIHPESYKIAHKFVKHCTCILEDLGTPRFIEKIQYCVKIGCNVLAETFGTDETTMEIIIKGLCMKKDEDIRLKKNHPLFRNTMMSIKDLTTGSMLTGAVRNVTHFGAFVDIGVGRDGLIPMKWMKNQALSIGQRVEVKVLSVDVERSRISLELIKAL